MENPRNKCWFLWENHLPWAMASMETHLCTIWKPRRHDGTAVLEVSEPPGQLADGHEGQRQAQTPNISLPTAAPGMAILMFLYIYICTYIST